MKHIAFGAGGVFFELRKEFTNTISYLVDNNEHRQGCKLQGLNVFHPDVLLDEDKESIFIWITAREQFYEKISSQLKQMGFIEGRHFASIYGWSSEKVQWGGRKQAL